MNVSPGGNREPQPHHIIAGLLRHSAPGKLYRGHPVTTRRPCRREKLEELEKRLSLNPFGPPAISNRDNSWSAAFQGGFITYVVSNRHVVINVIDLVAV
ncbi:hypothetical protein [Streptomyces cellulosae]|uniref:hypothetical protein n=1 Tax=Streptomyces cellulosae TaxID=1968 RepID=UPI000AD08512|nr:hypothetical protein [Streptomyces cellulosae]